MPQVDETVIKRVMPHSVEAEQSVIGSMIMDREAIVVASDVVTGDDFYNKQYGVLSVVVFQFFHQADLCFLFYRFVKFVMTGIFL